MHPFFLSREERNMPIITLQQAIEDENVYPYHLRECAKWNHQAALQEFNKSRIAQKNGDAIGAKQARETCTRLQNQSDQLNDVANKLESELSKEGV
jgi:hypothetical protein